MRYIRNTLLIIALLFSHWLLANENEQLDSLNYDYYLQQVNSYGYSNLDSTFAYCDSLILITQKKKWGKRELDVYLIKAEFALYGLDMKILKESLNKSKLIFGIIKEELKPNVQKQYFRELDLLKAQYYMDIGYKDKSVQSYLKLLLSLEKNSTKTQKDSITMIGIYYALGSIYKYQANFELALNYYYKGIQLQKERKIKLAYIADVHYAKKDYQKAIELYTQSLQAQKLRYQKSSKAKQKKFHYFLVSSFHGLAKIYQELRNEEKSIDILEESLFYHFQNSYVFSDTYYYLGQAYKSKGDYLTAIDYFQKTLAKRKETIQLEKNYLYARDYRELGNTYLAMGQTKKALSFYQEALINLIPNFNSTDYQINPTLNQVDLEKELIEVFNQKSLALQKLYLEENKAKEIADLCMATAELGIELIDDLRKEYGADTDKQFLLAQSYQLFEIAIEMAFESKQFEKAFQLSERSKAIVLYQAIKNKEAERLASTDEASLERLYQIRHGLQICSAKIRDERDSKNLNELRDRKFILNREYENLIHQLEKNSDFKKTKEELPSLSVADIQTQVLQSDQAFVEYFVGKKYVYAFYLQPNATDLQCKKIPWTNTLQKAAKEINNNIYQKENTAYLKNARLLYQELLASIFTEGMPKRLLLIPDDVLGFVPFNALLTKDVPSKDLSSFKAFPYLVKNTIITRGFSAAIQREMQEQKKTSASKRKVLAYAPGFLNPKTIQEAAAMRNQFMNLHHNTKEVGYMLECFNGEAICDEKATKKHFIQHSSSAEIIHLASHAEVNRLQPNLSYIAFSNLKDTTSAAVIMYVEEIYNISLNASMVVLSACETGIGDLIAGEGMISLARAFTYAGAKSIVTSLWKITDQSSSQLMGYFYTNLKNKQDKDVALNKALNKYIDNAIDQDRGHPKYWAAFIIIGDTDVVNVSDFPWTIVVITLLILGAFLFWNWKKSKLIATT